MSSFQTPVFFVLLMLVAGLGIPVMATLNGGLGVRLNSPALATAILFAVGGLVASGYLFLSDGIPEVISLKKNDHTPTPLGFFTASC